MKWIRRLYDWVLTWAYSPYAVPALFVLAFSESSFFPVPPDVLLLALAISVPRKAFYFALVCSDRIGSGRDAGISHRLRVHGGTGQSVSCAAYGLMDKWEYVGRALQ